MEWLKCLDNQYEIGHGVVGEDPAVEEDPVVEEDVAEEEDPAVEENPAVEEDSEGEEDKREFYFEDACNANDRHEFKILEIEDRDCLQHTFIKVDEQGNEERFLCIFKEVRLEDGSLFISRKMKIHTGRKELVNGNCAWSVKREKMEKLIPWLIKNEMNRYFRIK